jgi:hypothetical protein
MAIKNADLADLIATTLSDLPKQYFEVAWDNEDYEFCRIYQKERMEVDGGDSIKRKVMLDNSGNARYRRLYDTDEPIVGDVMTTITVPWTQIGTNYSWDVLEIKRNSNSAKGYIRLMEVRRIDGLWSLADLIEDRAWKTPQSATDDLYPYGVPYYLNFLDASATTAGFNAGTVRYQGGTTGTSCAGIDTADEAKWKNYAAIYSNIDNALLKVFRKAFIKTRFKAPLFINDPAQARNASKRIYCDSDTAVDLQDLADQRDDKHTGKEILGNIRMDDGGLVYINRLPVVYIPQLESYTEPATSVACAPIFCVDFRKFIPYVQDGYWMVESEPMTDRRQHTTFTVFLDGSHNNLCTNRRTCGFVLHKAI